MVAGRREGAVLATGQFKHLPCFSECEMLTTSGQ
uniref:Uncharacterized protein n=1 Tax=Arundo donax TaxID=35708 RepID=A0A0A8ZZ00_ARUDO